MKTKLAVVSEWVSHATLYQLKDHSSYMTDKNVLDEDDFESHYYAIVEIDELGCWVDTVEDDFKSAEEAWKRYDELVKEK